MERTSRDFTTSLDSGELERTDETNVLSKQFQSMLEVSKLWSREHGVWEEELHRQLIASKHFLLLEPVAALPFPPWLLQLAFTQEAEVVGT